MTGNERHETCEPRTLQVGLRTPRPTKVPKQYQIQIFFFLLCIEANWCFHWVKYSNSSKSFFGGGFFLKVALHFKRGWHYLTKCQFFKCKIGLSRLNYRREWSHENKAKNYSSHGDLYLKRKWQDLKLSSLWNTSYQTSLFPSPCICLLPAPLISTTLISLPACTHT